MKALTRTLVIFFALSLLPGLLLADDTHPRVRITTNMGDMVLELDREKAPKTVENFLTYVNEGFYDGTIFHRVIDGFMIQGGGFTPDFQKKDTHAPIRNEADNGLRNKIGTIAMARTGDPHSATAQFFINVANNSFLDFREKTQRAWGYTVFGRVVQGMPVVDKIRRSKTGSGGPFRKDVPRTPVIIEKVTVETTDAGH
ncbi:MAG TPA: peptidyl-prolyl cis-trans isomerase [Chromatiales bacterium]|nr:peptidyl-prolyl cis-trans isomerase [Chromatiales bacterium]HEX22858.1 peptidyl-prolyl cis-trans isomerase [Chromatiales bacterium]